MFPNKSTVKVILKKKIFHRQIRRIKKKIKKKEELRKNLINSHQRGKWRQLKS